MANISDVIEEFLLQILGQDSEVIISRNELANYFSCAPSQINYVLSTRFTPSKGYCIESRRGGGGSITVVRLSSPTNQVLFELMNQSVADGVSFNRAKDIIELMVADELITEREGDIIRASLSDKALVLPTMNKDTLRAGILQAIVTEILKPREQ